MAVSCVQLRCFKGKVWVYKSIFELLMGSHLDYMAGLMWAFAQWWLPDRYISFGPLEKYPLSRTGTARDCGETTNGINPKFKSQVLLDQEANANQYHWVLSKINRTISCSLAKPILSYFSFAQKMGLMKHNIGVQTPLLPSPVLKRFLIFRGLSLNAWCTEIPRLHNARLLSGEKDS